jgi:hypothetical protein
MAHIQIMNSFLEGTATAGANGTYSPNDPRHPNHPDNPNNASGPNRSDGKHYPQPNTDDVEDNCVIVSTAQLLLDPDRKPPGPYTTEKLLKVLKAKGVTLTFSGKYLGFTGQRRNEADARDDDGPKYDPEIRSIVNAFGGNGPHFVSFYAPGGILRFTTYLPRIIPKETDFAVRFDWSSTEDHVVVGKWFGEEEAPTFKFTDFQTRRNGADVTETAQIKLVTGVWWFDKP